MPINGGAIPSYEVVADEPAKLKNIHNLYKI
jgi:hypothetical protein